MGPTFVPRLGDHAIVIASTGRPEILRETLEGILLQHSLPEVVMLSVNSHDDLPATLPVGPFEVVVSPRPGMSAQLNAALARLPPQIQFVTILDDDMELAADYLELANDLLKNHPNVVAFNGHTFRNGDISRTDARDLTQACAPETDFDNSFVVYRGSWGCLYGCNMNLRRDALCEERFDERLPLYSLMSDTDLGFRLKRHGDLGGYARCKAIHLQTRSGRVSEVRLGFAQVMNPVYLVKKKIGMPVFEAVTRHVLRVMAANMCYLLLPDPRGKVDRLGRLKGNLIALSYLARGRIVPEAMAQLQ